MRWHIIVETEKGEREEVGQQSHDLAEVFIAALGLADDLGRMTIETHPISVVHIISDTGTVELSITAFPGGLDPTKLA